MAIDFEGIITKQAGEDGNIPAANIAKLVQAISAAVGREFVAKERYNSKLEEIETLKADKQKAEDELTTAKKWEDKYSKEREAFERYKSDTEARDKLNSTKDAYRDLLKESGIDPKRINTIIKATNFDGITLDKDGKLEKTDDLKKAIENDWADFRISEQTTGAPVANPPAGISPAKMTKAEIMAIKDAKERQTAIAENHELFGF